MILLGKQKYSQSHIIQYNLEKNQTKAKLIYSAMFDVGHLLNNVLSTMSFEGRAKERKMIEMHL